MVDKVNLKGLIDFINHMGKSPAREEMKDATHLSCTGPGAGPRGAPLQFDCQNHDDIFAILALSKGKLAMSEQEHQAFIVGLKLFGEVMMQHRKEELFKGFSPFQAIHGATETHRQGEEAVVAPSE